ncbi:hypothetical protein DDZ16_08965 [Marinilabilia rubra]|uniref:Uncharacterized protein n=1 Tax=Marinilabilia rubra TaxID=2162893 RepID=A0A2U2B935_9BACT|nr:hypothetical protein DDZ16_08965 [Marinilabilia rubra]
MFCDLIDVLVFFAWLSFHSLISFESVFSDLSSSDNPQKGSVITDFPPGYKSQLMRVLCPCL